MGGGGVGECALAESADFSNNADVSFFAKIISVFNCPCRSNLTPLAIFLHCPLLPICG